MSPKPTQSRPQSPQKASDTTGKGNGRKKPQKATQPATGANRVRSVLIEPREDEPPRVSVSVEYSDRAPNLKQLKKLAVDVAHDAVSRGELVDLGYREQQRSRLLTQTFECREKGEADG